MQQRAERTTLLTSRPTNHYAPLVDYGKAAYNAIEEVVAPLRHEDPIARYEGADEILTALNDTIGLVASQKRAAVRQLRTEGWTQAAIANRVGVTPARIAQIEYGLQPKRRNR